jgi:outer membrane immunogenic protein
LLDRKASIVGPYEIRVLIMKKIILATALLALGSASAFAADLGERGMYAKAPAMAPVANWSGLYVGGNVGYGWGNGTTNSAATTSGNAFANGILRNEDGSFDPGSKGVLGGAQIGYNWQMGSLVTGLEADIQGSGIKGSVNQSTLHPNPLFPSKSMEALTPPMKSCRISAPCAVVSARP